MLFTFSFLITKYELGYYGITEYIFIIDFVHCVHHFVEKKSKKKAVSDGRNNLPYNTVFPLLAIENQ